MGAECLPSRKCSVNGSSYIVMVICFLSVLIGILNGNSLVRIEPFFGRD